MCTGIEIPVAAFFVSATRRPCLRQVELRFGETYHLKVGYLRKLPHARDRKTIHFVILQIGRLRNQSGR